MVRRGQSKAEPPSVVADLLIKQKTKAGSVSFLEALLGSSDAWERSSQHTYKDSGSGEQTRGHGMPIPLPWPPQPTHSPPLCLPLPSLPHPAPDSRGGGLTHHLFLNQGLQELGFRVL